MFKVGHTEESYNSGLDTPKEVTNMKKVKDIENAVLLDLEEARELMKDGVRFVVWEGCIQRQYSNDPLPVHGCELWLVGTMDGMLLCVTAEVKSKLITSSIWNLSAQEQKQCDQRHLEHTGCSDVPSSECEDH